MKSIKLWLDKKDICPYCKSKEIFGMRSELSKRTKDSTVLLACHDCEGIFGYYTCLLYTSPSPRD